MPNEWLDNMDINKNDEDRQSLVKDAIWWDEVMINRENVRCALCDAYVFRKDSKRINNVTVCNECVKAHDIK